MKIGQLFAMKARLDAARDADKPNLPHPWLVSPGTFYAKEAQENAEAVQKWEQGARRRAQTRVYYRRLIERYSRQIADLDLPVGVR